MNRGRRGGKQGAGGEEEKKEGKREWTSEVQVLAYVTGFRLLCREITIGGKEMSGAKRSQS